MKLAIDALFGISGITTIELPDGKTWDDIEWMKVFEDSAHIKFKCGSKIIVEFMYEWVFDSKKQIIVDSPRDWDVYPADEDGKPIYSELLL